MAPLTKAWVTYFAVVHLPTLSLKKVDIKVIAIISEEMETLFQNVKFPSIFVREDKEVIPLMNAEAPQAIVFDLTVIDREVFDHAKQMKTSTISISPVFEWMDEIICCSLVHASHPTSKMSSLFRRIYASLIMTRCEYQTALPPQSQ